MAKSIVTSIGSVRPTDVVIIDRKPHTVARIRFPYDPLEGSIYCQLVDTTNTVHRFTHDATIRRKVS